MYRANDTFSLQLLSLSSLLALVACSEQSPVTERPRDGTATSVRYDITTPLLADVPWPNDSLCWTQITSNGPCLPNIATAELTPTLATWMNAINDTAGWSSTATISLPFQRAEDAFTGPAIDLSSLLSAQRNPDFADDAIYLVDLETGIPVALDFDRHLTSFVLQQPFALDPSDPRGNEPSLLVETLDERYDYKTAGFDSTRTSDGKVSGAPVYRPKWDYDSDGLLDVPTYQRGRQCSPSLGGATTVERDRCLADNLIDVYDSDTDKLRLRPRSPLRENAAYAVVVTTRLLDNRQRPVQSAFATAYHPGQRDVSKRVEAVLSNADNANYFGSLAGSGLTNIAFLWGFTTTDPIKALQQLASSLASTPSHSAVPTTELVVDEELNLAKSCSEGTPRDTVEALIASAFALTTSERAALSVSLSGIASIRTGTFRHPDWVESKDGELRARTTPGEGTVEVPFLITLPPAPGNQSVLKTVVVGHDFGTNRLDGLRWAGNLARFGVATVLVDRANATLGVTKTKLAELQRVAKNRCSVTLLDALVRFRSDNHWGMQSPLLPELIATRDLWRTSAVELATLASLIVSNSGSQGLPKLEFSGYLGQGEGAAVASLAATLSPTPAAVVLVDPTTSPHRAWARGTTWGASADDRLTLFGPRVAGVPSSMLSQEDTRCSATEASIRLVTPKTGSLGQELDCLQLHDSKESRFVEGATVVATNLRSNSRRCVTMTSEGAFSLGLPAETGDDIELAVYDGAEVVRLLGRDTNCELLDDSTSPAYTFNTAQSPAATELPQLTAGLGLERQSAEFRAVLDLADNAFALANPRAFLSKLGHSEPGRHATGVLLIVSPGDTTVSPDEGLSAAVALGLVPNLPDESLVLRPNSAEDTTPTLLKTSLRADTAELALAEGHLAEGAPRLLRHDPEPLVCGNNRVNDDAFTSLCPHAACATNAECPEDMKCNSAEQQCVPSTERCAQSLYDLDALAGDLAQTNAARAPYLLRLGRYGGAVKADTLAELWQPRTIVKGGADANTPHHPEWAMSALSLPLASPWGSHGIVSDDVCQIFRFGAYVPHVIGRYLASKGRDYSPILSWETQTCLQDTDPLSACE